MTFQSLRFRKVVCWRLSKWQSSLSKQEIANATWLPYFDTFFLSYQTRHFVFFQLFISQKRQYVSSAPMWDSREFAPFPSRVWCLVAVFQIEKPLDHITDCLKKPFFPLWFAKEVLKSPAEAVGHGGRRLTLDSISPLIRWSWDDKWLTSFVLLELVERILVNGFSEGDNNRAYKKRQILPPFLDNSSLNSQLPEEEENSPFLQQITS